MSKIKTLVMHVVDVFFDEHVHVSPGKKSAELHMFMPFHHVPISVV